MSSLRLNQITADPDVQPRAKGLDQKHVEELADAVKDGAKLPPVVVYDVGDAHLLSEGFHRHAAYTLLKKTHIPCEIRQGTREECKLNALASNQGHGLKRTNADKMRALTEVAALQPKWSDGRIAEFIGVSRNFVAENRPQVATVATSTEKQTGGQVSSDDNCPPGKRVGKDGKLYPATKPNPTKTSQPEPTTAPEPAADTTTDEPSEDVQVDVSVAVVEPVSEPEPEPEVDPEQVAIILPKLKAVPQVDAWGIPIQDHATEAFAAVPKFGELVSAISAAQRLFNEVANSPGGRFLTLPDVSSYRRGKKGDDGTHADRFVHEGLETALRQVKAARPTHTVCPWHYVEGAHPDDCPTCKGLNWTPELGGNIPEAAKKKAQEVFGV